MMLHPFMREFIDDRQKVAEMELVRLVEKRLRLNTSSEVRVAIDKGWDCFRLHIATKNFNMSLSMGRATITNMLDKNFQPNHEFLEYWCKNACEMFEDRMKDYFGDHLKWAEPMPACGREYRDLVDYRDEEN